MEEITFEEFKKLIYTYEEKDLFIFINSTIKTLITIDKSIFFIRDNKLYINNSLKDEIMDCDYDVQIDLNNILKFYKIDYDSKLKIVSKNNIEIEFDFDINS